MAPRTARRRPIASLWPAAARCAEHEQLDRVQANPHCCITWMLEGQLELVALGRCYDDYAGRTKRLVPFMY